MTLRYPPYTAGGYELLTQDAVEGLRARGHEVAVLCAQGKDFTADGLFPVLEPELDTHVDLFAFDRAAAPLERLALHYFRRANFRATRKVLREYRPELVLYFNLGLVSLAPLVAARLAGVPRLGYICDPWVENHWLREMAKRPEKAGRRPFFRLAWRALRRVAGLPPMLAASEWLLRRIVRDGWAAHDVQVLPTGLSPVMDQLARNAKPLARPKSERLRLICTSMLWGGKGQHVLVQALGRAVAEGLDAELTLAGREPAGQEYLHHLLHLAAEARISDRVHFSGMLSPQDLSAELASHHVFVLPSIWGEPFGLATIEAMAHGICVVVSDSGASPELVGSAGIVVPTEDVEALARTLLELGGDEERRVELGARARERALATYGRDVFLERLEAAAEAAI